MKNQPELKGKGNQVIGRIKEKAGEALDNPDLESEGRVQNAEGQVQETVGTARRKVGETVTKVGKKISGS